MKKIKVFLVDDHPMVRQGLRDFLSLYEDIEVVGEAFNADEAIERIRIVNPDIVLMDLIMPGKDGAVATKEIEELGLPTKVIALTSFVEEDLILKALRSGAVGYLMKDVLPTDLVNSIREVNKGIPQFHPEVAKKLMNQLSGKSSTGDAIDIKSLTDRELEVLKCIARGLTNQAIAEEIHVSIKTVKTHVSNIIHKLDVNTRTQAALLAVKRQLV